jgi:hypothetical protein
MKTPNHGPFRVFKRADLQTNQGTLTDEEKAKQAREVKDLAQEVLNKELSKDEQAVATGFVQKAKDAMGLKDPPAKKPIVSSTHVSSMVSGVSTKVPSTSSTTGNSSPVKPTSPVKKWGGSVPNVGLTKK